jgi:hypothetical protein
MPISTTNIIAENHFGWFISNGRSQYLRKDGTVGPTTKDDSGEYGYWPTEEEAYAFLEAQQQK